MDIVFLSHSAFGGPFSVGSHHLADGLAALGHDVWHVVTPVSPAHVVRRRPGGNAEVRRRVGARARSPHGAVQLIPLAPLPAGVAGGRVGAASVRWLGRELRRELPGPVDRVVVDQPLLVDVVDGLDAGVVVYRPTDRATTPRLRRAQERLAGRVDRVVTTTREVFDALPTPLRALPHLDLPNGVDTTRFTPAVGGSRDGFVYVGALDERFDWAAVAALAAAFPRVPVTLHGPVDTRPPAPLPAWVRIAGPLAVDRVPEAVRRARVALMPFNDHPRNTGRSPMKLWEYLASGVQVVASATPALRRDPPPGVHLYDADPVAAATAAWAASVDVDPAAVQAAAGHSWAGNTRRLLEFLR